MQSLHLHASKLGGEHIPFQKRRKIRFGGETDSRVSAGGGRETPAAPTPRDVEVRLAEMPSR